MRLDKYLAQQYPDISRSALQQYIKAGTVTVNGQPVTRPSYEVTDGDSVDFAQPKQPDITTELNHFAQKCVLYQDDNVIVVNKPAGMLVHAKGGIAHEFTVADYVRDQFNPDEQATNVGNNRLGIVHRLDRATSGVMICARNLATASMLSRQFAERKAHKVYLAVVECPPLEPVAQINLPIARNLSRPATFRVDAKGKVAITDYQVLHVNDDGTALLELRPHTGRTHQLRVHLAHIGCPIVGDPVYGKGNVSGRRLMLHAWQLEITIPGVDDGDNERRIFIAEPPQEFGYNDN